DRGFAGDEVAQLYLDFPDLDGVPRIALRGFQRVTLAPGERRALEFDLDPRALSAVDVEGDRQVMPGRYRIWVGSGQPGTDAAGQGAGFTIERGRAVARLSAPPAPREARSGGTASLPDRTSGETAVAWMLRSVRPPAGSASCRPASSPAGSGRCGSGGSTPPPGPPARTCRAAGRRARP